MNHGDFEDLSLLDRAVLERRLRDAESRLAAVWDHRSVGIVELDQDMRFVKVNPAFELMVGYSAAELCQMSVLDITEPEDLSKTESVIASAKTGNPDFDHFTKRNIRKDGSVVTLRIKRRRIPSDGGSQASFFSIIEDISQEAEREKRSMEVTAILKAIFRNSVALVYVKDTEGRYVTVNSATERFLARTAEYLAGKTDFDILPAAVAEIIRNADDRVLNSRATERLDEVVPGPNGIHHFHSLKFPVFNDREELVGMCGISYDVTELHKKNEEVKTSRQFLDSLMDNSPAIVFAKDLKGRYTHVNEAFARSVQLSKAQIIGKTLNQLFPGREAVEVLETEQAVASTKTPIVREEVLQTPGGLSVHAVTRFPLLDAAGNVYGICGMATDITELRRLAQEQSDLMTAINSAAVIAVTDRSGKIVSVNDNFCEISGYEREELLGKTHALINSGLHEPAFFANLWRTIAAGRIWRGEIQNRRKDGGTYWMNTVIAPLRGINNAIERYIAVRFDVTEQKVAQRQLIEANRLSSLAKVYENLAHEINNPLTVIGGKLRQFVSLLSPDQQRDPKLAGHLGAINNAVDRIAHIIRSLRAFAGKDGDEGNQPTTIGQILDSVVSLVSQKLKESDIELQVKGVRDVVVSCRVGQFTSGLLELVQNAVEALDGATTRRISIETREVDDGVQITVSDTGKGVRREIADRIMDPFFTTKAEVKGVGLGLSIAKGIVERHKGKLYLDQNAPQTTFVVQIPKRSASLKRVEAA